MLKRNLPAEMTMIRRCTRCVLPETYPGISFDNNGVCNYCLNHRPVICKGESALLEILSEYRNRGQDYDCIVPISGGKDSAFVLYQIKKVYGMRTLAFNYDSGFVSRQAKENLFNIFKILNVDFVLLKSNRNTQKRCLLNSIRVWTRKPSAEPLPTLCYGCKNGYLGGAYRIAKEKKIPLIVMGDALIENGQQVRREAALMPHKSVIASIILKFLKNPFYLNPKNIHDYLYAQMEFPLPRNENDNGSIRILHFYDFVEYDQQKILSTVEKELNWKKEKVLISTWRFDCEIHAILEYFLEKKFGFTEKDEFYSEAIRNGKMTREEALNLLKLERDPKIISKRRAIMENVFQKLNLSEKEKHIILNC